MDYIKTMLGQSSTWQGLGFFVGFAASLVIFHTDMAAAVAAGASVSAAIKVTMKDQIKEPIS